MSTAEMKNRVALVTGASRGIGRQVAADLAAMGYDLVLIARDAARLADVEGNLRFEHGVTVRWSAIDVCAFDAIRAEVEKHSSALGHLDVLVNAAGIFRFGTSAMPLGDLDALLATNVKAVHNLCAVCRPALERSERAHIFNIASITGVEAFAPVGGYGTSKFALVGYSLALAKELLRSDIKVTVLCPDVVDTDMAAGSGLASEQMIAPEDICGAIRFALSLSPAAVVDQVVIKCRTMVELANVRG